MRCARMAQPRMGRRALLGGLALAVCLGRPALAQGTARVAVVGGGFAGATCARELRRAGLEVTLVEPNPTYTACPMSNAVIAGLRDLAQQRFGYDAVRREGVTVVHQAA